MGHVGSGVTLDNPAFVHETAQIYGNVILRPGSSVWPYSVFRAEMHHIDIGEQSNIQDFVMVHVGSTTPTLVGRECSITHHVTLHGCTIGDFCLIGIGATIMDGASIGEGSIVAGHSIVTEGSEFPPHSIIAGSPAKLVRQSDCTAANRFNARFYHINAQNYAKGIDRLSGDDLKKLQDFRAG